jgi:phage replication-related protein YjqB (UPF0714/DUF867 family)
LVHDCRRKRHLTSRVSGPTVDMTDKYRSFSELAKRVTEGKDFQVRVRHRDGATAVIAPHGGGIEPGTSEVAEAIADADFSFYAFEGIRSTGNGALHIKSTRFDEPRCLELLRVSPRAITIHGERSERPVVFLGGRDWVTLSRLRESLSATGFRVEIPKSAQLQGLDRANVCNRTAKGVGIQLELSEGLRHSFFESPWKSGRRSKTDHFDKFVGAVRAAIDKGTV